MLTSRPPTIRSPDHDTQARWRHGGAGKLAALARAAAGGVALGLLAAIKLNFVLLVPWLVLRGRRLLLASAATTFALLITISAALAGGKSIRTYYGEILPLLGRGTAFCGNESLLGAFLRADADVDPTLLLPGPESGARRAVWAATGLALIAGAAVATKLLGRERLLEEGILWTTTLLATSPVSWSHHYVLLIPLLALALSDPTRSLRRRAALLVIVILLAWPLSRPCPHPGLAGAMSPRLAGLGGLLACMIYDMACQAGGRRRGGETLDGAGRS